MKVEFDSLYFPMTYLKLFLKDMKNCICYYFNKLSKNTMKKNLDNWVNLFYICNG